jgi:hypothetical protein
VTDQRETTDQLDLFRQPLKSEGGARPAGSDVARLESQASVASPSETPRRTQMTELAGETWEDAFGDAA